MNKSYQLDKERATSIYTPEMIATIQKARRFRIENKTRERKRELRGEITNRAIKKMKKGPPAFVLDMMNDEDRRIDKVMREVSRGGYSGRIKMEERARRRSVTLGTRDPSSAKSASGK